MLCKIREKIEEEICKESYLWCSRISGKYRQRGLNEIVSHGIDGMKSYAGNANSLADSILEVLFNQDLCKQIAKNAHEKVVKEFNWDTIAKNTMKVYKETIKSAKASTVKVKFEDKEKITNAITETINTISEKDTTITTDSTDSEISGILPNPLRKLKKVTE